MIDNTRKPAIMSQSFAKSSDKFLPATCENAGNKAAVIASAMQKAIKLISNDSPRNCLIRELFSAPNTLRIPTSPERFEDLAVERFMKLIQAISKVNRAIEARIYK